MYYSPKIDLELLPSHADAPRDAFEPGTITRLPVDSNLRVGLRRTTHVDALQHSRMS